MDRAEIEFKFSNTTPEGKFDGYGSVFNNMDSYGDVIVKGAFKSTLAQWKSKGGLPKMLLQHGGGFLGGAEDQMPIGVWTNMKEDDNGLYCEGQLFALNTQKGQYIYEGMKSGALDGLSIGFRPKEFVLGTKPSEPARTLKAIDLLEVSVVTFPANDKATVTDIKSLNEVKSLADCEKFAREAYGLSRKDAVAFVSAVKRVAQRDAVAANNATDLLSALRQARQSFTAT